MKTIETKHAPAALGPYSQAKKVGNLVFLSGQIGINPETGKLAEGLEAQAEQVCANIEAVLKKAGADMEAVVKTTCFLTDMLSMKFTGSISSASPPEAVCLSWLSLPGRFVKWKSSLTSNKEDFLWISRRFAPDAVRTAVSRRKRSLRKYWMN